MSPPDAPSAGRHWADPLIVNAARRGARTADGCERPVLAARADAVLRAKADEVGLRDVQRRLAGAVRAAPGATDPRTASRRRRNR